MRYRESREQSAELLRMVVALMAQQPASFHPASYALWYEHAAGLNPTLSQVLEQHLKSNTGLTDEDVWRLHAQHIVARDVEAIERLQEKLSAVLAEASQAIGDTGTHAAEFGAALQDQTTRLTQQPNTVDLICQIAGELLTATQRMCAASLTTVRRLDASTQEVRTLRQHLQEAQTQAFKDALTGLLNRYGFERAIADLAQDSGVLPQAALLLLDVDHFKRANDSHGHLMGDQVLRAVAQVLRARLKGADIAARFGGDEFAVLLPNTALAGATALADQIRTTVPQGRLRRIDRGATIENVTLSIGVAHGRPDDTLESLLHLADAALYQAKEAGRNRVVSETDPLAAARAERRRRL